MHSRSTNRAVLGVLRGALGLLAFLVFPTFSVEAAVVADLSITDVASPNPVVAGTTLTYTVTVINNGPSTAENVSWTWTSDYPADFQFQSLSTASSGWTCSTPVVGAAAYPVTCTAPSLSRSLSAKANVFTIRVEVFALLVGDTFSSYADVTSSTPDPNSGNNHADTGDISVSPSCDLELTISDSPDPVTAGGDVTYTIVVANNGQNVAHNIAVTDTLPAGTTFVSASPSTGGTCTTPAVGGTGAVNCIFPAELWAQFPPISVILVLRTAAGAAGTVISDTASVTQSAFDPDLANNSATTTTTVVLPDKADLSIAATDAPDPVTAGQNLTYSITATNNGPNPAQNLHIADALPGGTAFVSASAGSGGSCSTPAFGGTGSVVCTFAGATASAATRHVTLAVAVSAGVTDGTVLSNTATTSSDTSDPSGGNNAVTVTTTVHAAPPPPDTCSTAPPRLLVPIVLDVASGSAHFTTELSLTNKSDVNATLSLTYTAALGDKKGSGTVSDILPAGRQLVLADALQYLRQQGLDIPASEASPQQGGTLLITFNGVPSPSDVAATARTTAATAAPQPVGAAGLAYSGTSPCEGITDKAVLYGLRSTSDDRSNVAVFNTSDQPVSFKVTVLSGVGDGTTAIVRQSDSLEPWGWTQYTRILDGTGITNGVCVIERTSSTGSFGAYLVINDNATNDGSFALPSTGALSGDHLTLPVLVETASFQSELVLSNSGGSPAILSLNYVESLSPGLGAGGSVTFTLASGEQRILPNAIDALRKGGASIGPENAASYAGAVRVTVFGVPISQVFVGARTASRSAAGGQFGLFTPPVYPGQEASDEAFIFGLQANSTCRANVAALNAGASGAGSITLELSAFDGDDGLVKGSETVVLAPGQWAQVNGFLQKYGVANGWARVRRIAGSAGWAAYGVVNDGGNPGERTGDGAFVAMAR